MDEEILTIKNVKLDKSTLRVFSSFEEAEEDEKIIGIHEHRRKD